MFVKQTLLKEEGAEGVFEKGKFKSLKNQSKLFISKKLLFLKKVGENRRLEDGVAKYESSHKSNHQKLIQRIKGGCL